MRKHLVFDVESIGLHGEGFAVGYVVVDEAGSEIEAGWAAIDPQRARGAEENREWVRVCVPPLADTCYGDPAVLRTWFWRALRKWQDEALVWADCGWPVEAGFLAQCVADMPALREWSGPYPVHEIATAALLAGGDPLAKHDRQENELPQHHPLADARLSARLLVGYLKQIKGDVQP